MGYPPDGFQNCLIIYGSEAVAFDIVFRFKDIFCVRQKQFFNVECLFFNVECRNSDAETVARGYPRPAFCARWTP
jgi:hypothetical protein